jgi:hypothetical protein
MTDKYKVTIPADKLSSVKAAFSDAGIKMTTEPVVDTKKCSFNVEGDRNTIYGALKNARAVSWSIR